MSARTRPAEAAAARTTRTAGGGGRTAGAHPRRPHRRRPRPAVTAVAGAAIVAVAALGAALGVRALAPGPDHPEQAATGAGAGAGSAGEAGIDRLIDFDGYQFGVPPDELWYGASGPHGPVLANGRPMWRTYTDVDAPSPRFVLLQASTHRSLDHFPVAVLKGFQARDVTLTARVKVLGGEVDQAAGLVWRVRDEGNYYGVLASATDRRLRLFRMVGGRGELIGSTPIELANQHERDTPLPDNGWYTLRVDADGDRIVVRLGGRPVLEARDATFPGPGAVGLVTHADAVSAFDDVQVQTGRSRGNPINRRAAPAPAAPVLHVDEVVVTEAAFRWPLRRARLGDPLYFKVRVAGADGGPVGGAMVDVAVVGPAGRTLATGRAMTGTDGYALFTQRLPGGTPAGTVTVTVRSLGHADRPDARHDRASDKASTATVLVGGAP
jgi:hypothetical protein